MAQIPDTGHVTTHTHELDFGSKNEASSSAVSWAAVAAGAFVAAALALILTALGAGAGLSSLSPWSNSGLTPSAVGMGALLWLAVIELVSSAMGGYLAGRLRTKWVNVHSHEVYFRDTAHGFLVWAVALVMTAGFLTTAATVMVGGEVRSASASRADEVGPHRYFIDRLFRTQPPTSTQMDAPIRGEISMIFSRALVHGELTGDDKNYVVDAVASRTGMSTADADKRVADVFEKDQEATNAARKAVAHSLYWLFVALLVGAFAASYAATIGGRQRDHMYAMRD